MRTRKRRDIALDSDWMAASSWTSLARIEPRPIAPQRLRSPPPAGRGLRHVGRHKKGRGKRIDRVQQTCKCCAHSIKTFSPCIPGAKGAIAGSLIQKARAGELGAQIFYLKTQAGWRETTHLEHTSPDGSMTPTAIERVIIDKTTDSDS